MDYVIAGLQGITVDVHYMRGGALAYHAVTFAGYVGVLTGVRPGVLAVTVDERDTANSSLWANAGEALLHGGRALGLFLRETLDSGLDFEVRRLR
jgi:N-acylethanolamine-hydrolysing acid amidase